MKIPFQILFLLISLLSANAKSIVVCQNCPMKSIEDAYAAIKDCDTIVIKGGQYHVENIIIKKQIAIIGENNAELISKSGGEILTIASNNTCVSGLKFSGVKTNFLKENAAIHILKIKEFEISRNIFEDCFFAIYIEKGKRGKIFENTISGNAKVEADSGNGIHAWYCDSLEIHNNTIRGHRDGIYFEFVNNSKIYSNRSYENLRYGLHFMFSNDDQYTRNTFENNGVGVAVMFSRRIKMLENMFLRNWGHAAYGLLLKEIYDAEIVKNTFKENTVGIFVEGSNRINYERNDFIRNGYAIKFSGGCESNHIAYNNFLHNSLDMLVSSKLLDNSVSHNYWSEYAGYDLDKNGNGDIPYYPVKLYSYILNQVPESVVLMRSLFVEIVNFAEKISPQFTPKDVFDASPKMTINQ